MRLHRSILRVRIAAIPRPYLHVMTQPSCQPDRPPTRYLRRAPVAGYFQQGYFQEGGRGYFQEGGRGQLGRRSRRVPRASSTRAMRVRCKCIVRWAERCECRVKNTQGCTGSRPGGWGPFGEGPMPPQERLFLRPDSPRTVPAQSPHSPRTVPDGNSHSPRSLLIFKGHKDTPSFL